MWSLLLYACERCTQKQYRPTIKRINSFEIWLYRGYCEFLGQTTLEMAPYLTECDITPVSYTHLDVYKRQAVATLFE